MSVLSEEAPYLRNEAITAALREAWGIEVTSIRRLESERDFNVMVNGAFVLKVSNPAEDPAVVDMEVAAMAHAALADPKLPVPSTVPMTGGNVVHVVSDEHGRACLSRLITVLPGEALEGSPITVELAERVGAAAAQMSIALAGFLHHAAGERDLDWDIRRLELVAGRYPHSDPAMVARLRPAIAACRTLPGGVQHGDVTLTNVLTEGGQVSGLIDFGDMHHTANACDLAVTLTSVVRNTARVQVADTWALAGGVLRGYQRHRLLTHAEVEVLGELVLARLVLSDLIARARSLSHSDNLAYISQYDDANTRVLTQLSALAPDQLATRLHQLAGTRSAAVTPDLRARRDAVMGGKLSPLFYDEPLHIVSGEGPWLIDDEGKRYLDAYNNVAVVGHADPTVANRVARQLRQINTHSRYLHPEIVELAERLVATMPPGLDTVLFTTSGTEANEVAWRLATEFTGGDGAMIVEHSYHGSTKWMADLSSNEWPPGHRPAAIGRFPAPRETEDPTALSAEATAAHVAQAAADLASRGLRPAMLLADSGFTSEGVHDAPASYFEGLLAGAHAAGALYLADEVQIGYGRTGPQLWRFMQSGVTPDFVTLGKPMGAGYPIGAVITRREIADRLAQSYEYFSTFAATPAAAAAGNAVLDVLTDRRLPEQALEVGAYLAQRLHELAAESATLGEVRHVGLVAGVDVQTREETKRLVNGLAKAGVLAGSTGPTGQVLKVRPPLVWERQHVDQFIAALAHVLDN